MRKSSLLFLCVCLPLRVIIVVLAASSWSKCGHRCRVVVGALCLFFCLLFVALALKKSTATRRKIVHAVHAVAYLATAIMVWAAMKNWWVVLAADTFIGLVAYKTREISTTPTYINISPSSEMAARLHVT